MTGRGGAEGYLFTAVRVIPAEGKVAARGKFSTKKRKIESGGGEVKDEGPATVKIGSVAMEKMEISVTNIETSSGIGTEAIAEDAEQV